MKSKDAVIFMVIVAVILNTGLSANDAYIRSYIAVVTLGLVIIALIFVYKLRRG